MRLSLVTGALLLGGSSAFAGSCLPGTLQDYINLGPAGCTLGRALYSDFHTAPGQSFATPIPPSEIQVVPDGTLFAPSLEFVVDRSATAADLFESFFHFEVSAPDLQGAMITLENSSATGIGAAIASADICPGGAFNPDVPIGCPTSAESLITFVTAGPSGTTDSRSFTITSFFDVFADLTIDGGLAGTAHMGSARFEATTVPEPSTALLMVVGCGAVALGRVRRYL